jgi:hypothetical protein
VSRIGQHFDVWIDVDRDVLSLRPYPLDSRRDQGSWPDRFEFTENSPASIRLNVMRSTTHRVAGSHGAGGKSSSVPTRWLK